MQTNELFLVFGMPKLISREQRSDPLHRKKGSKMSKTAALGLAPSASLFSRLMATIDGFLMASARTALRNGDLPYFGL